MTQINLLKENKVATALNATNSEANNPQCIHAVGLGKAGCESVAELIKQPEVSALMLSDIRATLAVLCLDTEDTYLKKVTEDAKSVIDTLINNGIKPERIVIKTIKLSLPKTEKEKDTFFNSIKKIPQYFKLEYPMKPVNPNYESWINPEEDMIPKEGDHMNRSMAKAIYLDHYYRLGLKKEIQEFCNVINNSQYPGYVSMFYGLAGGFGSGIAADLARHLSNVWFGRRQTLAGYAYLPDEKEEKESLAATFAALEEMELSVNSIANAGVMKVFGQTYMSPWIGSYFLVAREADDVATDKGIAEFIAKDNTRQFVKSATCTGKVRAPWTEANNEKRPWNVLINKSFDAASAVNAVKNLFANDGAVDAFKSDYINIDCYTPDSVKTKIEAELKNAVDRKLLSKEDGGLSAIEYSQTNTCKINVVLPGLSLRDLKVFQEGKAAFDALNSKEQMQASSYLLDCGIIVSKQNQKNKVLAGESFWKTDGFIFYPYKDLRSEDEVPVYRPVTYKAGCDAFESFFIYDENPLPGEDRESYIAKFTKPIGYNMRLRG